MNNALQLHLEFADRQRLKFYGQRLGAKEKKRGLQFFKKKIADEQSFHHYSVENGALQSLVIGFADIHPLSGKSFALVPCYFDEDDFDGRIVSRVLQSAAHHLRCSRTDTMATLYPDQKKLRRFLEKRNFELHNAELVGRTEESLKNLKRHLGDPCEFVIRPMSYNHHAKATLDLIRRAHNGDPSSLMSFKSNDKMDFIRAFIRQSASTGSSLIMLDGRKIIGEIGFQIATGRLSTALLGSISVDPKYRGQGLAKHLYLAGMKHLKEKKIKTYFGYSRTDAVLGMAKLLNRVPARITLVAKGRQLL